MIFGAWTIPSERDHKDKEIEVAGCGNHHSGNGGHLILTVELGFKESGREVSSGWLADEFAAKLTRALKEQIAAMRNEVLSAPHELGSKGGGSLSPHGEREWPAPKVVGINEAARLLGIRPSTLRVRVKQNRIRSVRIGRRVLVPMESIEKVVREGMPSLG